jgi:hypothetical protein
MMKRISLACFACLLGNPQVFSLLGMWRNELGNLISLPQESMQKRFVWMDIVCQHLLPTFILLPKPFFPNPNLKKNHASELC